MVKVIWARHGENVANLTRQFSYRRLDLDLTPLGREQAAQLAGQVAERLGDRGGSALVFSSPLRRAQQTAVVVAERLGVEVEVLEGLRELNVGDLDGRSDAASWQVYEQVLQDWRDGRADSRFPGGEDRHELCARLTGALQQIALVAKGRPALVVAHGANLRAALPELAGVADPGADLGTGQCADLDVALPGAAAPVVSLLTWGAIAMPHSA